MFDPKLIEVAISLALIFTAFAVAVSALSEWISSLLRLRSQHVKQGIWNMMLGLTCHDNKDKFQKFYDHPVIQTLKQKPVLLRFLKPQSPSRIDAKTFIAVFTNILMPADGQGQKPPLTIDSFRALLESHKETELGKLLWLVTNGATQDLEAVEESLTRWFDSSMERVGEWYRRTMWIVTFALSVLVAVLFNADAIQMTRTLWADNDARAKIVKMAESQPEFLKQAVERAQAAGPQAANPGPAPGQGAAVAQGAAPAPKPGEDLEKVVKLVKTELAPILPIGWESSDEPNYPLKVLGLLVSALAIAMGAPFWFSLMTKFLDIRLSVVKRDETQES